MTDIKIVSGLNYGDESKGLVANAISTNKSLTILASNSCQRGHTVIENGIRKVFRHFGTATLKGAANYFTDKFYVNPAMFRNEYLELLDLGIKPIVFAKVNSIIITPMDMFASMEVEKQMGKNSHSTTGTGVWQGLKRNNKVNLVLGDVYSYENVNLIGNYYVDFFKEKGKLTYSAQDFYFGEYLYENFKEDLDFFINNINFIYNDEEEKELLRSYPLIVFENSQGLLLDNDWNKDIDHNTPAHVGVKEPMKVIDRVFNPNEVNLEALYVTRTYLTRHGKGEMVGIECDKADINSRMIDRTNVFNAGQGDLRYGKFDKEAAGNLVLRAIGDFNWEVSPGYKPNRKIVITHTNEYNDGLIEEECKRHYNEIQYYTSDNETDIIPNF